MAFALPIASGLASPLRRTESLDANFFVAIAVSWTWENAGEIWEIFDDLESLKDIQNKHTLW